MDQPWKRQPGEGSRAYEAFWTYATAGAQRSIVAVGQKLGKNTALLFRWSTKFAWVDRAGAYDDYLAEIEQRKAEAEAARRAKVWRDRDEKLREDRWTIAQKLLDKAEKMLQFPLSTVRREAGPNGEVTIVNPARWSIGQAARMIECGIEQAQGACRNTGSLLGEAGDGRVEEWVTEDYKPETPKDGNTEI